MYEVFAENEGEGKKHKKNLYFTQRGKEDKPAIKSKIKSRK